VVLVSPDGEVFEGAEAVFRSLAEAPGRQWPLEAYRRIPGFAAIAEAAYRLVARHRTAAGSFSNLLWGQTVERPTYRIGNALFLRAVGLCFFAAFLSLWVQVDGLVGSQ
jgi:predicted DCC family thiol-disulfide oxidoreductase YuxK